MESACFLSKKHPPFPPPGPVPAKMEALSFGAAKPPKMGWKTMV